MTPDCERLRPSLGAYVLGGLEPAEAAALEEHLASCPDCRSEHASLAGLPALLARVSLEQVEAAADEPVPSETGLRRLLDRVGSERARRRRRARLAVVGAAAATVIFAGAGVAVGAQLLDRPETSADAQVWAAENDTTDVSVTATLEPFGWGTRVDAVMNGMRTGDICLIRVVDHDGTRWDAGSWLVGDDTEDLQWAGDVGVPLDDVARVEIWDGATNRRLVSAVGGS